MGKKLTKEEIQQATKLARQGFVLPSSDFILRMRRANEAASYVSVDRLSDKDREGLKKLVKEKK